MEVEGSTFALNGIKIILMVKVLKGSSRSWGSDPP
jgi:hypothetical protein